MPKAIIRKRVNASRKKDKEPGILERLNRLTSDAPVAKIRGKSFVFVRGGEDSKPDGKTD